jgi:hypothetical protein
VARGACEGDPLPSLEQRTGQEAGAFIKLTAGNYCPLRHRKSLTRCGEFNIRTTEKITVTCTPERQISVGKDLSTVICGGTRAEVSADGKGMIAYTNDGVETNSTRLLLR